MRGRRGNGTIIRRDGRYQAQWSSSEGGKRLRKSATFTLRSEAEWWLREARRGQVPDVDLTTYEYLERWLIAVEGSVKPSTWISYADHVRNQIKPRIGGIPVTELQPRHVDGLMADLRGAKSKRGKPYSPTTIGLIVTTLRIALGRGVKRRELPDNAAADVALPRKAERLTPVLTKADAAAIQTAVKDSWLAPIVRLLIGSGLRLGEACGLDQRDLELDKGYVVVRLSKTRTRAVRVSRDAVAALREALAEAPRRGKHEPVFFSPRPNREGVRDRLRGSSVTHALSRDLQRAGLAHLSPHGLRHGAASLMLAAGTPMRAIAEQLGHSNPGMTARVYAHVAPETLERALDALDDAVSGR